MYVLISTSAVSAPPKNNISYRKKNGNYTNRFFIQVPTAKFRTWSQRRVSTDGGSYDYLRVRAEMVSDISKKQKRIGIGPPVVKQAWPKTGLLSSSNPGPKQVCCHEASLTWNRPAYMKEAWPKTSMLSWNKRDLKKPVAMKKAWPKTVLLPWNKADRKQPCCLEASLA